MIPLSEIFYSLQGEGPFAGRPAIFVRTSFCNLNCGYSNDGPSKWKCDTWNVMTETKQKVTPKELAKSIHDLDTTGGRARVVFTGGEPFLYAKDLAETVKELEEINPDYIYGIDIETNGTLYDEELVKKVAGIVVISPKLSSSGISKERRINKEALISLVENSRAFPIFKFVIASEEDIQEVLNDFKPIIEEGISRSKNLEWRDIVWFMPAMETISQGLDIKQFVWKRCVELGVPMSLRTHIEVWDKKVGV
jgi:7-carboxy-7-deazaguanine synthase